NVAKHAESQEAWISLQRCNGILHIEVKDKGKGFDRLAKETEDRTSKFGLFSIRERMSALGGSLEIDSAPGHGTTARLTLSLNEARKNKEAMIKAGATLFIHKEAAVEQLYEAIQRSVNQSV